MKLTSKFPRLLVGVGALLWIVPLGVMITTILKNMGDTSIGTQLGSIVWAYILTAAMLPIGLGLFIGGLTLMLIQKKDGDKEPTSEETKASEPAQASK